jgi:hypothetical protein
VGPNDIEKHFVEAHQKVLGTFNSEERRKIYEKTAPRWRTAGKIVGWTATAIDTALAGFGVYLTAQGFQHPEAIRPGLQDFVTTLNTAMVSRDPVHNFISRESERTYKLLYGQNFLHPVDKYPSPRDLKVAQGLSAGAGAATLVPILGFGPAHWLGHIIAEVSTGGGKLKAKTANYIDSGKAAEHARKVGSAVGSGLKYTVEHQDQVTKLVKTAQQVQQEAERHKHQMAAAETQQARMKLEQGYTDWMSSMAASEKAFYTMSNSWPPPIEEYKRILAEREKSQKSKSR